MEGKTNISKIWLGESLLLKRLFLCFFLVLATLGLIGGTALGADISVYVDGSQLALDVPPAIQSGRTLLPLRSIFIALGAEVDYNAGTITGMKTGTTISLSLGSKVAYISGSEVALDVPAQAVKGRTLVPLLFVSQALGAGVDWDASTKTITITSGSLPKSSSIGKDLAVHFIDVGQGDAILLESPTGKVMLVDGGPRSAGEKLVSYLKKAGITSIDIVVATHPHEDHIGGSIDVLENFPVGKVYDPEYPYTTKVYSGFLGLMKRKEIKCMTPSPVDSISLDSSFSISVFHPDKNYDNINDNSIVLKVQYGSISFLLTGDVSQRGSPRCC